MSDLIIDIAATKVDPMNRQLALHAIRVLAANNALDLAPMLFQPTQNKTADDRYNERRRQKRAGNT